MSRHSRRRQNSAVASIGALLWILLILSLVYALPIVAIIGAIRKK